MIQVIQRAFGVLEILAADEPLPLRELAARTRLNKSTLCVILKSLVELGYARKTDQSGQYATGPRLQEIAFPLRKQGILRRVAEQAVRDLTEATREAVNAAVVHRGERYTLAHATYRQALMVDSGLVAGGTFYSSATGRLLLAHMPAAQQREIISRLGMPGAVWPEVTSPAALATTLAELRWQRVVLVTPRGGEIQYLAAPVCGPSGEVWMALGLSLPMSRFRGEHRAKALGALQAAADRASREIDVALGAASELRPRTDVP